MQAFRGRVFFIPAAVTVSISGMTLENGNITGTTGGSILNTGNLTLTNVIVTGNHTDEDGAGIMNLGILNLNFCIISYNQAGTNSGCASKDQNGTKRRFDGDGNGSAICDIGAFEFK